MILNQGYITKIRTPFYYLLTFTWVMIALFIAFVLITLITHSDLILPDLKWEILALIGLMLVYMFVVPAVRNSSLKRRNERLRLYVEKGGMQWLEDPRKRVLFRDSLNVVDTMHGARRPVITNLVQGDDWEYGDLVYETHSDKGQVMTNVYYGIMTTKLPRVLPNVFFDSRKARGRQFRFEFARKQRHTLEGDFNKFFDTYFPAGYTIDSMSFISPDVMWVLREAADYDIEIFGDRIFLYSSLYDPEKQLPDMAKKLAAIKKELLDNILTYRDARLPYADGRKRVTMAAMSLKRSAFWTIFSIIVAVLYIILRFTLDKWLHDN